MVKKTPLLARSERFEAPRAALLLAVAATLAFAATAGCKPERPDVEAERRATAAKRAEQAKAAAESGAAAASADPTAAADLTPEEAAKVVARVDGAAITLDDVAAHIATMPIQVQARYAAQENREKLLESMVQLEVLAREAEAKGLQDAPNVRRAWKEALASELLRRESEAKVDMSRITEDQVKAWYEAHPERYRTPERRRAALLVSELRSEAQEIWKGVSEAIRATPIEARRVFGDFVDERSADKATALRRGDVGLVDESGVSETGQKLVSEEVAAKLFSLAKVGDVSEPFALSDGRWAIVQLTHLEPAVTSPLADVRQEIRNALFADALGKARADTVTALMAKAKVEVDQAVLAEVVSKLPPEATEDGITAVPPPPRKLKLDRRLRPGFRPGKLRQVRELRRGGDPDETKLRMNAQEVSEKMKRRNAEERGDEEKPGSDGATPAAGEQP